MYTLFSESYDVGIQTKANAKCVSDDFAQLFLFGHQVVSKDKALLKQTVITTK